jgi:hypothetical protein
MKELRETGERLTHWWADYSTAVILASGAVLLIMLLVIFWRFWRSRQKSRWLTVVTALVVMAWTSEGVLAAAVNRFAVPVAFVVIAFFVFEALLGSAGLKAAEKRRRTGHPGAPGYYMFVIATVQGIVAATGAHTGGEVFLRLALPILAVGWLWIDLTDERDDDSEEIKAERVRRREDRDTTWAVTPSDLLVRIGLKKPGRVKTSDAQRDYDVRRMVVAADVIAAAGTQKPGRRVRRARKRLRRLARTATPEMIAVVAEKVQQAVDAERLMVPAMYLGEERTGLEGVDLTPDMSTGPEDALPDMSGPDHADRGHVHELSAESERTGPVRTNGHVHPSVGAGWIGQPLGGQVPEQSGPVRGHVHQPTDWTGPVYGEPDAAAEPASWVDAGGNGAEHLPVTPARVSVGRVSGEREDQAAAAIAQHREELDRLLAAGKLTRYQVQKLTGLTARPADRVLARLSREAGR